MSYGATSSFGSNFTEGSSANKLKQSDECINQLSSVVDQINQMNKILNTASDSATNRSDLTRARERAKEIIQKTALSLEFVPSPSEKAEHSKIIKRFGDVVAQCKQAIQIGLQKEASSPARDAASEAYGNEVGERMRAYEQDMAQITITESATIQVDNQVIRENNDGMKQVASKLTDLHAISESTALLVESQQEFLTSAEVSSGRAAASSKAAVRALDTGMKYQSRSRRKYCVIFLAIFAGVLIVALIIGLFVGLTKGLF